MKIPQRPVWSEGMFMSPQHLQALDRSHEMLVASRLAAVTPYDWGVLALELDRAALGAGQVRLQRFAGILPDGTTVSFEENDSEAPPQRAAADRFPPAARTLDVHLGVPRERDGVSSYAEEGNAAARTRYLVATRPVQDATAAGATVPVAFARLNTALFLGDESRADYETLKIAEIVRGPAGQLAVAESYIPPCLRIAAAPALVVATRQVLARAISKQRDLADGRRQRELAGDQAAFDLTRLVQLLALNANLPILAHAAETADASPRDVYLALAQLAGALSTFAPDADPSLPKFAYTDLRSTFEPLFGRLSDLLGSMAVAQYVIVQLEQRPGGLHLARIQDDRILRSQLFLAVKSELSEQQVAEQVPRLCKIASTSEIEALMRAAAPGLPLKVLQRPPPQIPLRDGTQYFALSSDDRHWQSIVANRNIALYLPPPFDPLRTKVELFAIAGKGSAAGQDGPTGK